MKAATSLLKDNLYLDGAKAGPQEHEAQVEDFATHYKIEVDDEKVYLVLDLPEDLLNFPSLFT